MSPISELDHWANRVVAELEELLVDAEADRIDGFEQLLFQLEHLESRLSDPASPLSGVADRVLSACQDARWELMAIEAEQTDPGDAPVFDDPEQMIDYIRRQA